MAETGRVDQPSAAPPAGAAAPLAGHALLERFSTHGTAAILTAYLSSWLLYDARGARAGYHLFLVAAGLAALLGGWLADRLLGRYRAILWGALLSAAGHAALVAWPTRAGLAVGLGLVALGAGTLRACVPGLLEDQGGGGAGPRLARRLAWLAWSAGLASAAARLVVPELLRSAGPAVAFAVPGAAVALSAALLWAGRGALVRPPTAGPRPDGFLRVTWRALRRLGTGRPGEHWLDAARDRHPAEAVEGAKAVFRIMGLFAVVPVFWSLFDQTGSSWVLQARALGRSLGGWTLDPSQLQAAGPLLALLLAPLLGRLVFPALARRGRTVGPLQRVSAGLFAAVLAFVAAAVVQRQVDLGHPPHVLWQLPQYLLLTVGEVLVSVTGLEFITTQAPRAMRSAIMSIWFLTVVVGNLVTWLVNRLVGLEGAASFLFFAGLMLAAALVFRVVARRIGPAPAA